MVGLNRHILRLFMVLFTLAGITLLKHSVTMVTHAAGPQVNSPAGAYTFTLSTNAGLISNGDMTINSSAITDTVKMYLPIIQREMPDCGVIITNTIWTEAGSPYLVSCDAIVVTGVTLTITAGVTVEFTQVDSDLIVLGTLQVEGTETDPIRFQPVSNAEAGNWGRVAFMASSSGVLDHAIVEYGGSSDGLVYIASDAVKVVSSVVQHSANTGIVIQKASPLISGTQILSNTASVSGGGLYNDSGSPIIQGNIITENSIYNDGDGSCYGGGLFNADGNPTIQNNLILNNSCSGYNGYGSGVYNESGSPIIQNNTLSGNSAYFQCANLFCSSSFGGGLYNGSGNPTIQNNAFTGNSAAYGGGFYNESGNPIILNNTFSRNYASFGGGLYTLSGNPIILNNTFSDNSGGFYGQGGGLYIIDGSPNIRSNIVVSNWYGGIVGSGAATHTLDYNDVWDNIDGDYGGSVTAGAHDISADPLLVDPANGDFHLSPSSPCIDAGDPVNYPPTDFEGDPRPCRAAPDIGADEYCSPP